MFARSKTNWEKSYDYDKYYYKIDRYGTRSNQKFTKITANYCKCKQNILVM